MDKSSEDPLLIDLDKSAVMTNDRNPPLIPAPNALVSPDNNPFDAVAQLTNQDPFEMVLQKAFSDEKPSNATVEVRYDLVSLNDSDEANASSKKKIQNESKTHRLVLSNSNIKNGSPLESSCCNNSFLSPIYQNLLHLSQNSRNKGNSPNCTFDDVNSTSKKSNTSMNISSISSLRCISENSNNESDNSVFLNDIAQMSDNKIKDFVAARIQNVIKGTLNKSFAGFHQSGDSVESKARPQSMTRLMSANDSNSSGGKNESGAFSDFTIRSDGSMNPLNQAFLKTSGASISDSILNEKQEASQKTSTPLQKYEINSSLFQSPPVEILREATRLSRSFSVGSNNSEAFSNCSSKSHGSTLNRGFLKNSGSSSYGSILNEKSDESQKTSTPSQNYKINSSLFQSPPVEILREATRLSRSFSLGSTFNSNAADKHEDLHSIKPKWETLDSSSDEDSDDSLKSLRLNFRSSGTFTPSKPTPDSEALKKFKKRLSLVASAESGAEKEPAAKPRSRSADRMVSDSALKSLAVKACPVNLQPALPVTKLEDVKLRPKNPEVDAKAKRGPMKAFVPLKNMLRGKDASVTKQSKPQTISPVQKPPVTKKSSIKPAASSTPKRNRKPLAENNARDSPNSKPQDYIYQKHRRSNSYDFKNVTPDSKVTYRSSSASRVSCGIKPPTPISKLPGLFQGSPHKAQENGNTTPKKRNAIPMLKARQNLYSGKENINQV